jgi:hypothetical protein
MTEYILGVGCMEFTYKPLGGKTYETRILD